MEKSKFKIILIGIIFDPKKREILIGKDKGDLKYTFLDCELNYNEELDLCLKRVTKEKTGYKIHNLGTVYARNKILGKDDVLELYFLCEATEGKEKPGKEVKELKWINPCNAEKIMQVKFPSRLKEYIDGLGLACPTN
ncbi:MAG: NUDIX domain-containing protein [Candidatus Pacearchaeota archaeon]|jgi:ADP-ribose pyrophosphatase YjhB (NUDIX family)